MFQHPRRTAALPLLACLSLLAGAGCQHNASLLEAQQAYRVGNLAEARAKITQYSEADGDGRDQLIAHIEQGSILRTTGEIEASNLAFTTADQAISRFQNEADVSLSQEGTALFTNLNFLKYRGTHYDRIMVSLYRAMNFLTLGDYDSAEVELIRVYERQRSAVAENAKRIEEAQEDLKEAAARESETQYDVERARQDPAFQASLDAAYAPLEQFDAYEPYVNPFAEFFQGLYFMANPADASDRERARVSLERARGMVPDNAYLAEDLELATNRTRGAPMPALTYVIFETGVAPHRDQIRIDIPLFLLNDEVDYVGAAFPKLVTHGDFADTLTARADGEVHRTELLADMDAVVAREFKNELPVIVTKTLLASGTKALAAYLAKEATKDEDPWVALGTRIGAIAYQASQNQADLRTWATLPKQVHYARFPTPESGIIQLQSPGTLQPMPVSVAAEGVNVVVVRSINRYAPLQVTQFNLVPGASWQESSSTLSQQASL
jgi:hypothetical protein